jgi:sugar O-acyltransferase (sialic acid O-acetyltransferase NeuD family)
MKKVLIFGGPGPASVIGEAIIHANSIGYNEYEFSGFINDKGIGNYIDGYPILGTLSDTPKLIKRGYYFIYTIYKIGGQVERIQWFRDLNIPNDRLATFVHPLGYVAPNSDLSSGCVVMPGASVSGNTKIGTGTLLMNGAAIGHDNEIGAHNFFTAKCCLGSWIKTGLGVWVGLNSTVRGRTELGDYSAIGIGSVVTKNVGANEIWIGNPAKFYKMVSDKIKL